MTFRFPLNPDIERIVDWQGALIVVGATVCLTIALIWGGDAYPWDSGTVIGLFVGAVCLFALWIFWETHHRLPLLNMKLFKIRTFSAVNLSGFLFGGAMMGLFTFLPMWFLFVDGDASLLSGVKLLPAIAGISVGSGSTAAIIKRTGHMAIFLTVGGILLTIALALLSTLHADSPFGLIALYQIIAGFGLGEILPCLTIVTQNAVPLREMASATGANGFSRFLGGSILVSVCGSILNNHMTTAVPDMTLALPMSTAWAGALDEMFMACAIVSAVGVVAAMFARDPPRDGMSTPQKVVMTEM